MAIDVEDGDDKTRRNLVVASGALITAWIAGVPVPVLMERLVGKEVSLTYWRVFLAALAVLTYMILRFRFAPDTTVAIEKYWTEWDKRCWAGAAKAVNRALDRYTRSGREAKLFDGKLGELVAETTVSMLDTVKQVDNSEPELGRPEMTAGLIQNSSLRHMRLTTFDGFASISFAWKVEHQRLTSTGASSIGYKFTRLQRQWTKTKIFASLALYSESSLKLFVPVTLAGIAYLGLLIQLAMSVYPGAPAKVNAPAAAHANAPASSPTAPPASAGTPPSALASRSAGTQGSAGP